MSSQIYDVVIIGAGPAGLTAGIYASRAGLSTVILEKNIPGGQILTTEKIENYPGFEEEIGGFDFIEKLRKQTEKFGAQFKTAQVEGISKGDNDIKIVKSKNADFEARSVIIAAGAVPRKLGIPGEAEFTGRGVSYCAVCDAMFFKNKEVVVVGGGDTAVEEALFLTKFCTKVTLIHRRDRLRATKVLQQRLEDNEKIALCLNAVPKEICGQEKVSHINVEDTNTKEEKQIQCDGVFVFVGYIPSSDFVNGYVEFDKSGYIITDQQMRTCQEGVFACGDVRSKRLRQVVTACGEGAAAAYSAQLYVEEMLGKSYPGR